MKKLLKRFFYACVLVVVFAAGALAAEGNALARVAEKNATQNRAADSMGAGNTGSGRGTDLKAIASSNRTPTTFTGFPAGTLPGDSGRGAVSTIPQEERVVVRGEPLPPVIDLRLVGTKLDRIYAIVDHAGYSIVRRGYAANSLDGPYTFSLMSGRRRLSTLYFDREMRLVTVR
ncbi:MAG: hypothetical protein LBQ90_06830 [Synergistaceae bacterium]|nr:hypothetical protein [Synergistaceae bacterium]